MSNIINIKKRKVLVNKSILPVQPKDEYDITRDGVDEFIDNYMTYESELNKDIANNPSNYRIDLKQCGYAPGMIELPPIDMGYGYTANIGKNPFVPNSGFEILLNKQFRLRQGHRLMTVGLVMPEYGGKHGLAVFTERFLKNFERASELHRGVFFFMFCASGLLTIRNGKIRWLFTGGLATGEMKDNLYYFDKLSFCMQFPDINMTHKDLVQLENVMWQVKV